MLRVAKMLRHSARSLQRLEKHLEPRSGLLDLLVCLCVIESHLADNYSLLPYAYISRQPALPTAV